MAGSNKQSSDAEEAGITILAIIFFGVIVYIVVQLFLRGYAEADYWWSETTEEMADTAGQKIELIKLMIISLAGVLGALVAVAFVSRSVLWIKRRIAVRREIEMFMTRK